MSKFVTIFTLLFLCVVLGNAMKLYRELASKPDNRPLNWYKRENYPELEDESKQLESIMAGSPCPVAVMKQVVSKMHMRDVTIAYGMTENSPVTFMTMMDDPIEKRVCTIGRPLDHVEVKVINTNGETVARGEQGEICTRGFTNMLYYWGDEEKTRQFIDQASWCHTGDMGLLGEDGFGQITGRINDMIIRGGENVYPAEIEQSLYTHPDVADVQVIGVPDSRLGEQVCAWIRLKEGHSATSTQVKDFCKEKLAYFKVPKYIRFVDSFPMTVTGKIQKFKMRQQMENFQDWDSLL